MTATLERYRPFLINNILVPIASIIAGFAVAAVAVVISGSDPVAAFEGLVAGAFTNRNAFAETLISSIPFVFLGLGVALGFRAGLFNIGAEGQYYIGGMAAVDHRHPPGAAGGHGWGFPLGRHSGRAQGSLRCA